MNNFTPKEPEKAQDVPFFEQARKEDGWAGQTTGKSIAKLESEISEVMARLGGMIVRYENGTFDMGTKKRAGVRIYYTMKNAKGDVVGGRLDAAALPCKLSKNQERSVRMMYYMLRNALAGQWFLQQLAPGYAALMPFLIVSGEKTVTDLWTEQSGIGNLLPPPSTDFAVDGEIIS